MPYVNVHVDAQDVLDEIDTDDLVAELKSRGNLFYDEDVDGDTMREVLTTIYEKRRLGKDYQAELDQLIYGVLGKIV